MSSGRPLSEMDRILLERDTTIQWVPEDPEEFILPYINQSKLTEEEKTDTDKRREKTKEIYDNYSNIVKECEKLEEVIEEKCKNVKVPVEPNSQSNVLQSLARVFGSGTNEITFEMYKLCIQELDRISNNIPSPEDLK